MIQKFSKNSQEFYSIIIQENIRKNIQETFQNAGIFRRPIFRKISGKKFSQKLIRNYILYITLRKLIQIIQKLKYNYFITC